MESHFTNFNARQSYKLYSSLEHTPTIIIILFTMIDQFKVYFISRPQVLSNTLASLRMLQPRAFGLFKHVERDLGFGL